MKQFIRYLYEYDRGNRIRNVGFTKVERQMDQCTVHIHGKGLDFGAERKLEVYLFYVKDGRCIGFLAGSDRKQFTDYELYSEIQSGRCRGFGKI